MIAPVASTVASRLPYRSRYDLMGFRAEVASNSEAFIAALDRLNAELGAPALSPTAASYEVHAYEDGQLWEITRDGEELDWCDSLLDAVNLVEWQLCDTAINQQRDLLHVHGAVLAGPNASVLLAGRSNIGKTTFALALALRGLRLLSDDVVFIRPGAWLPEPFPRSFHVHDDALPRLTPLGLRYAPDDHIGVYLCSTVLGPWERAPGPPLRYVLFPRLLPEEALGLEPISDAEAAIELMQYSKNLQFFPRFGLDLLANLMEQVKCYVLRRNDDLASAADLVHRLVTGERLPERDDAEEEWEQCNRLPSDG